jgi:Fic family protein
MNKYKLENLPNNSIDWIRHIPKISLANQKMARFDGLLQSLPNPYILMSPLMKTEAVISSKIEGTQSTIKDFLEYESKIDIENKRLEDVKEIYNYRVAMMKAVDDLKKKPLRLNTIKLVHFHLLKGVRGFNKSRGNFRTDPVWIGGEGTTQEEARYNPPNWENVKDYMHNFEEYMHDLEKDVIVQAGLMHAQFELIHPFLDGNGRVGRILLPLFFYEKKLISLPMFYMSGCLEARRDEYYDRLLNISLKNDWDGWINFFLNVVIDQAYTSINQIKRIRNLYDSTKLKMTEAIRSMYNAKALDTIFSYPILTSNKFIEDSKIPTRTAMRLLNRLVEHNILIESEGRSGSDPAKYVFVKLFRIIND